MNFKYERYNPSWLKFYGSFIVGSIFTLIAVTNKIIGFTPTCINWLFYS